MPPQSTPPPTRPIATLSCGETSSKPGSIVCKLTKFNELKLTTQTDQEAGARPQQKCGSSAAACQFRSGSEVGRRRRGGLLRRGGTLPAFAELIAVHFATTRTGPHATYPCFGGTIGRGR